MEGLLVVQNMDFRTSWVTRSKWPNLSHESFISHEDHVICLPRSQVRVKWDHVQCLQGCQAHSRASGMQTVKLPLLFTRFQFLFQAILASCPQPPFPLLTPTSFLPADPSRTQQGLPPLQSNPATPSYDAVFLIECPQPLSLPLVGK